MMDTKELRDLAAKLIGRKWPNFSEAFDMTGSSFEASFIKAANPAVVLALIARITEREAAAGAPDLRSAKLQEVIAFLMGEGPLDGFYFGDSDTDRPRAAFWWRKHLRAALASAAPVEALTDEEIIVICERECGWLAGAKDSELVKFARAIEARIMGGVK